MAEAGEMLELRARMTAWASDFARERGRPPDEIEWANAARALGALPAHEADRLAHATYERFGPEPAVTTTAEHGFTEFAVAILGPRRRSAIRRRRG